MVDVKGT